MKLNVYDPEATRCISAAVNNTVVLTAENNPKNRLWAIELTTIERDEDYTYGAKQLARSRILSELLEELRSVDIPEDENEVLLFVPKHLTYSVRRRLTQLKIPFTHKDHEYPDLPVGFPMLFPDPLMKYP